MCSCEATTSLFFFVLICAAVVAHSIVGSAVIVEAKLRPPESVSVNTARFLCGYSPEHAGLWHPRLDDAVRTLAKLRVTTAPLRVYRAKRWYHPEIVVRELCNITLAASVDPDAVDAFATTLLDLRECKDATREDADKVVIFRLTSAPEWSEWCAAYARVTAR